jgi:FkbM family methyltransferase
MRPLLNDHTYSYLQGVAKVMDIKNGTWYEPEIDLIRYAVRPGDVVLDLGANFGVYAYHLSKAVGAAGRVYAFEPIPFTSRTLALVIRMLGLRNVTLVSKGCSDRAGSVEFTLPIQDSGAPSAGQAYIGRRNDARPGAETQVRWNQTRQVTCEVVALDEFLPELKSLSLIKCDIEGAELLAFRGAARLIETHRPSVICEINPWFLDGFGLRLEDLVGFFTERGYRLYRYTPEKKLVDVSLREVVEDNYVFVHADRLPQFSSLLDRK